LTNRVGHADDNLYHKVDVVYEGTDRLWRVRPSAGLWPLFDSGITAEIATNLPIYWFRHVVTAHPRAIFTSVFNISRVPPHHVVEEDGHETAADGGRSEAVATPLSGASTSTTSRSHSSTRKRKAATNDDGTTDVMKLVGKKLESLQAEDAFQVFGKHVANKLRDVSTSQNAIAQKLISDVLFEAELGTLTRNFQIVNMAIQRQDDYNLTNLTNWHQQNMPQHLRMPNTHSSHVGQYHSFSQPMPCNYVPEQLTHPQEYETIGQTPTVSRIIPQEGEQNQQTHASQGLAHSSAANYMSTFQPN
ncbi:hypothetical protein J6590_001715, partial [Homalodisca vitripennis]